MKTRVWGLRRIPSLVVICAFAGVLCLSGCVADDEIDREIAQFEQSSTALTQAFQTLLMNANTVEANNYIDNQTFSASQIDNGGIQNSAVITNDEIRLRTSAIKALSDYTTALATLAAGKPSAQIQANASTASNSLKTLTSDSSAAFSKPSKGVKTPDYSTPVSAAVTAIGDVISLIEQHRGVAEVRKSIEENDPKIKPLYQVIEVESAYYYDREQQGVSLTGVTLFADYNKARVAVPVNQAELLQLSDRIKQYQKDSAALKASDPTKAIACFENAHDALIKLILAPKDKKKESMASLIAEVKSLAAELKTPSKNPGLGANSN